MHRYHNDRIPVCLQPIINDKIEAIASVAELVVEKKEPTPTEYRRYVKERDKNSSG